MGGLWKGVEPKDQLANWENSPDVVGEVSVEPRRVSHTIWQRLASKGECVQPPSQTNQIQGCNDANDCDDNNSCTVDVCEANLCTVSEVLENCCGNDVCEWGEGDSCTADCGPFTIQPTSFCEECYALDGFMFDVALGDKAEKRIFVSSISFMHSAPKSPNSTVYVYTTTRGSYAGKEQSKVEWNKIAAVNISTYDPDVVEIKLDPFVPLGIGSRRGFYLSASEEIILFGEGTYSIQNSHQVELHSSRAVVGTFGDGIDGFSLSCAVNYYLDDALSFPTANPTETPTELPSITPSYRPTLTSSKNELIRPPSTDFVIEDVGKDAFPTLSPSLNDISLDTTQISVPDSTAACCNGPLLRNVIYTSVLSLWYLRR